jgi:hypothetical protein
MLHFEYRDECRPNFPDVLTRVRFSIAEMGSQGFPYRFQSGHRGTSEDMVLGRGVERLTHPALLVRFARLGLCACKPAAKQTASVSEANPAGDFSIVRKPWLWCRAGAVVLRLRQ